MLYCPFCGKKYDSGTLCSVCNNKLDKYDENSKLIDNDVRLYLEYAKLFTSNEYTAYTKAKEDYDYYLKEAIKLDNTLSKYLSFLVFSIFIAFRLFFHFENFIFLLVILPSFILFLIKYGKRNYAIKYRNQVENDYYNTKEIFENKEKNKQHPNVSEEYLQPEIVLKINSLILINNLKTMDEAIKSYERTIYKPKYEFPVITMSASEEDSWRRNIEAEKKKKEELEKEREERERRREEDERREEEWRREEEYYRRQDEYYRTGRW